MATNIHAFRRELMIGENWSDIEFDSLQKRLQHYDYSIDPKLVELEQLANLLESKGDLLVRFIENPSLLEEGSFSELLRALIHFKDELQARSSLKDLPEADLAHLANDSKRAYVLLAKQWAGYMRYLRHRYPYLFSLALRTNPFSQKPTAIIEH